MPNPEPLYVRDCDECGEPRIATANRLQMKEGASDWTNVTLLSVRCRCGEGTANDRDVAALRARPLESAVEEFAKNSKLVDRLRGAALSQCSALHRSGHANPFGSVIARVRALNKAAGRQDERMEQFVAEACLEAEKLWKRERDRA
jgi:hypothetical protein